VTLIKMMASKEARNGSE